MLHFEPSLDVLSIRSDVIRSIDIISLHEPHIGLCRTIGRTSGQNGGRRHKLMDDSFSSQAHAAHVPHGRSQGSRAVSTLVYASTLNMRPEANWAMAPASG